MSFILDRKIRQYFSSCLCLNLSKDAYLFIAYKVFDVHWKPTIYILYLLKRFCLQKNDPLKRKTTEHALPKTCDITMRYFT